MLECFSAQFCVHMFLHWKEGGDLPSPSVRIRLWNAACRLACLQHSILILHILKFQTPILPPITVFFAL